MSTYTQLLYHIVFTPRDRNPVLHRENRPDLYRYITGCLQNRKCHLYRIGGMNDHIHLLTGIHPTIAVSVLIHDLKIGSTNWIKENRVFIGFQAWQEGYGAFTHSNDEKDRLIEYIINQEEHHRKRTFLDEYKDFLREAGIEFDGKYLS